MDLSNPAWAQKSLIKKIFGNTFGTEPSESVIICAEPNHSTTFGTVHKIRFHTVKIIVLYLAPSPGFDPENPRHSHERDSTLKAHGQAMVLYLLQGQNIKYNVWYG